VFQGSLDVRCCRGFHRRFMPGDFVGGGRDGAQTNRRWNPRQHRTTQALPRQHSSSFLSDPVNCGPLPTKDPVSWSSRSNSEQYRGDENPRSMEDGNLDRQRAIQIRSRRRTEAEQAGNVPLVRERASGARCYSGVDWRRSTRGGRSKVAQGCGTYTFRTCGSGRKTASPDRRRPSQSRRNSGEH